MKDNFLNILFSLCDATIECVNLQFSDWICDFNWGRTAQTAQSSVNNFQVKYTNTFKEYPKKVTQIVLSALVRERLEKKS